MEKTAKIYVAGHSGLVGSALVRKLREGGYANVVTKSRQELDLTRQEAVENFFKDTQLQYVIMCAAKVGGITANINSPAEFMYVNLALQTNLIHAAYRYGVKKLLFFGCACVYPRNCPQPMQERALLSGELEPTNEAYAIAKLTGMKMCESYSRQYKTNFISVIPANIYGPHDDFDLESSHVVSALLRKFHEVQHNKLPSVEIWGTGNQIRDFIYVDDVADAALWLLKVYDGKSPVNIGTGEGISIGQLATTIKDVVGYKGHVLFNTAKPDGMPRKVLDIALVNSLGWKAKTNLEEGITKTYKWFLECWARQ